MLNRKLMEVLQHFDPDTHKQFRLFLTSPYFNNHSNAGKLLQLYDRIVQFDLDEQHPQLGKAKISSIFFPDRVFRENTKGPVDALTTELFRLLRRFLAQQELEAEDGEAFQHLALAKFCRKEGLEERFWQAIAHTRDFQAKSPYRDKQYYFRQIRIEEEEQSFRGLYNSFSDDNNLPTIRTNLDIYYSLFTLELTTALEFQKRFAQITETTTQQPSTLLDEILHLSENHGPFDIPMNRIFRQLIRLFQSSINEAEMETLEAMLEGNQSMIPTETFLNLKSYCRILWIQIYHQSGKPPDFTFRIFQEHLEQGYFYLDGKIPVASFRNLVVSSLKLDKTDWVKNFLETHPPEKICGTRFPVEFHCLNTAEYYFYLKQYDDALETLVYRLFENTTFSILADVLLVKIYFDTQSDLLETRMKALDQKVRRAKLNREIKNRYLNFLKTLHKIIRYGWQTGHPKQKKLLQTIRNSPNIIAREWLLEKLQH